MSEIPEEWVLTAAKGIAAEAGLVFERLNSKRAAEILRYARAALEAVLPEVVKELDDWKAAAMQQDARAEALESGEEMHRLYAENDALFARARAAEAALTVHGLSVGEDET